MYYSFQREGCNFFSEENEFFGKYATMYLPHIKNLKNLSKKIVYTGNTEIYHMMYIDRYLSNNIIKQTV
jgi:hypothetical protein